MPDRSTHIRNDGTENGERVEREPVVEPWLDVAANRAAVEFEAHAGSGAVAVFTRGPVRDDDVDYALRRIDAALGHLDDPILFARLKLGLEPDPARARPALAQITIDVNGELVRAHVAGRTMREAADLLQGRLRAKLEQRAQHRHDLRTRGAARQPGEWRHGDLPTERPDYYDRPPQERRLVRHKTFAIDELSVDEAAFDMDQLDYDFHLFRDLASGQDAVLERLPGGQFRLTRLQPSPAEPGATAIELTIADTAPAELTIPEAVERLDADGEPFVFFTNTATGRRNVGYRRYDGQYGLITPA